MIAAFLIGLAVSYIVLCVLVVWQTGKFYDRHSRAELDRREKALAEREAALKKNTLRIFQHWNRMHDQAQTVGVLAVSEMDVMNDDTTLMPIVDIPAGLEASWEGSGLQPTTGAGLVR